MKKITISLIIFCLMFLNSLSFAKDVQEPDLSSNKIQKQKTEKKGFFNKKNKKEEEPQKGYYGTLPDINADFQYKHTQVKPSKNTGIKEADLDEIDEENLKEAPTNDTLFLDNVVKKKEDKSPYVNDLQKMKYALTNLKKCLEEQGDIQRFNACVNLVDIYCENFRKKYENTSDSFKESYIDILNTTYSAKVLGNLKYNANYYAKFVPTQQGQYSESNIKQEENKLLVQVNKTLFSILKSSEQ